MKVVRDARRSAAGIMYFDMSERSRMVRRQCFHRLPASWRTVLITFIVNFSVALNTYNAYSLFDGTGNMSAAMLDGGLNPGRLDILYDEFNEDILTDEGLAKFLLDLVRIEPGGILTMGPPSKSWIWLIRSVTRRSRINVLGNEKHPMVAEGNLQAEFVSNVILACCVLGIIFFLEQPLNSLLFWHPRVRAALELVGATRISFTMGAFGGCTKKPTEVWSNAPWLPKLGSHAARLRSGLPADHFNKTLARIVRNKGVTGNRKNLADSAEYPPAFCSSVVSLHKAALLHEGRFRVSPEVREFLTSLGEDGGLDW